MTEFLTIDGGTLAYGLSGTTGPLLVLAHGMGDSREAYRFLTPLLVEAGYRVAAVDLRGHGESSVGHSISGGAATIAAAKAPDLITALVELAPFTRKQSSSIGDVRDASYRRGLIHLMGMTVLGSRRQWQKYLDVAYPGVKPVDYDARSQQIGVMLAEPGRMKALQAMASTRPADAGEALRDVRCPVLVVQGSADCDWVNPEREGEAIVADLPAGVGHLEMIEGAGHYPHAQYPAQVATAMLTFLAGVHA